MKKMVLLPCFLLLLYFGSSCKKDHAVPEPEPEYSIFGTYKGTFTTNTTYYLYIDGDTTVKYLSKTEPGSITFKDTADSVTVDYRSRFYFPYKFAYTGNSYLFLHSGGGARTIQFSPKEQQVVLVDSFYEKTFYGYPEDPIYNYDQITQTTFSGTR